MNGSLVLPANGLAVGTNQIVLANGNVGIGTTAPSSLLSVGSSSQFQVNSSGDLATIRNVSYSWPTAQGSANQILTNNGSGSLSWASAGGGSSQWTTSGTSVTYNSGNVGIGTTNPGQMLTVAGTIESTTGGVKFPDGTTQSTAADTGLTSCPSGFTMVGTSGRRGTFCIDSNERAAQLWHAAKDTCRGLSFTQGRAFMCNHSEWYTACQDAPAGLTNMTNGNEYVDELTSASLVLTIGNGGCSVISGGYIASVGYAFRCCIR